MRQRILVVLVPSKVKELVVLWNLCIAVIVSVWSNNLVGSFVLKSYDAIHSPHQDYRKHPQVVSPSFGLRITSATSCRRSILQAAVETPSSFSGDTDQQQQQKQQQLEQLKQSVQSLKRVLEREYISFFDPMVTEYYAPDVTFDDPLTSLSGVSAYKSNVDMLSGRTWFGKFLFRDASIVLHSIRGGEVVSTTDPTTISDITTRWTLRFTFQLLPWKPTAVFSGISIYHVQPKVTTTDKGTVMGVQILSQQDYWDSINLLEGGTTYKAVDKSKALLDFLDQLNPNKVLGIAPPSTSMEVPYQLLRRGNSYEVRRYPKLVVAMIEYDRRDEGYALLGSVIKRGMNQLSPALMEVTTMNTKRKKTMSWPLYYQKPGKQEEEEEELKKFIEKASVAAASTSVTVQTVPEQVVAVRIFEDALTESAVRANDQKLRLSLQRDGLVVADKQRDNDVLSFAQYDAVYSLGKRRSEVWITLDENGHPW